MLTKKQLEDATLCEVITCRDCANCKNCDTETYSIAQELAKTALVYREMLERLEWNCAGCCPVCGWRNKHRDNRKLATILKEGNVNAK